MYQKQSADIERVAGHLMKIIYLPSNRQRKALLVQGQPIELALPAPPGDIRDPLDWARSVLPTELRPLVRSAEAVELLISPSSVALPTSLTDEIGHIRERPNGWGLVVIAIAISLAPDRPRAAPLPLQWPQDVEIDGVRRYGSRDPMKSLQGHLAACGKIVAQMKKDGTIDDEQQQDIEDAIEQIMRDASPVVDENGHIV